MNSFNGISVIPGSLCHSLFRDPLEGDSSSRYCTNIVQYNNDTCHRRKNFSTDSNDVLVYVFTFRLQTSLD